MRSTIGKWSTVKIAWAVAGVLAAALVVLVAWSFSQGDDPDPRRVAVEAYIADVNVVGQGLSAELTQVSRTYSSIAEAPVTPATIRTLEAAEASTARLVERLDQLEPPAEAETLHRRIVAFATLQSAFAADVTRLARYLRAIRAEATVLTAATRRLSRDLGSADAGAQQAAFDRYADDLDAAARALAAADVPKALEPVQDAEVARVGRLADLSARLRDALAAGDADEVERLLAEVGNVSRLSLANVQRSSIIAYNRQRERLGEARLEVEQEHTRLTDELG